MLVECPLLPQRLISLPYLILTLKRIAYFYKTTVPP